MKGLSRTEGVHVGAYGEYQLIIPPRTVANTIPEKPLPSWDRRVNPKSTEVPPAEGEDAERQDKACQGSQCHHLTYWPSDSASVSKDFDGFLWCPRNELVQVSQAHHTTSHDVTLPQQGQVHPPVIQRPRPSPVSLLPSHLSLNYAVFLEHTKHPVRTLISLYGKALVIVCPLS